MYGKLILIGLGSFVILLLITPKSYESRIKAVTAITITEDMARKRGWFAPESPQSISPN